MLRFSQIASAEVVVLMTSPTSFGPTVIGPDIVRRLYQGRRCIFFIASWRHEYNTKVSLLWEDVDVVFIPRFLVTLPYQHRIIAIPFLRWHDRMAEWLTQKLGSWLSGGRAEFLTLLDLYRKTQSLDEASSSLSEKNSEEVCSVDVTTQCQLLQMRVSAPPVRLPEAIRENITSALQRLWERAGHEGGAKLCCMYLRFEKRESYTTRLRNSSSLKNHLPAIRLLNEAGYQVLLTGDFEMDVATRRSFDGTLVDAESLGADNDIYQLFAASEASIFIGNNGGGGVIPVINEIPSLYLDWFPYSNGWKRSWVYFKSAHDKNGKVLSGRRLITDFVYDSAASFGTLLNNTQEEITDAVACFIEDVNKPGAPDPCADVAALIPRDSQFHLTGARLSPAWARRNILVEDLEKSA